MKRIISIKTGVVLALGLLTAQAAFSDKFDSMSAEEKAALIKKAEGLHDTRMEWWAKAKFGMFIHWGVYSLAGGEYKGIKGFYAEQIMRRAQIPIAEYKKELVEKFNPVKFDATEWVRICKDTGMKYMVITSKHHDGFAMFNSPSTDYDVVDATPFGRDPMKELKDACDNAGIRFGLYYSHAQDWNHRYGQYNTWDYDQPTEKEWWKKKKWINNGYVTNTLKYVNGKSIPQLKEIIDQYDPAVIWFDTEKVLPDYMQKMIVSEGRIRTMTTIFNSRSAPGFADYKSTADCPVRFPPQEGKYWEAIPTMNNSFGWSSWDKSHKPASYFIKLLARCCAKGGNLLLNVGPMGNGEIDPKDVKTLSQIGEWMKLNGDSIYGTQKTPLPIQGWGVSTLKGNTLYLHVLECPQDGQLVVGGLVSDPSKVSFLANGKKLKFKRTNEKDVVISLPDDMPDATDSVIAVECSGGIKTDVIRLISPNVPQDELHVFDGKLVGKNIQFGSGNQHYNGTVAWTKPDSYVAWDVRINETTTFNLDIVYDKLTKDSAYHVVIDGKTIPGAVKKDNHYQPVRLGQITLEPGTHIISVVADRINGYVQTLDAVDGDVEGAAKQIKKGKGGSLMILRSLVLTPVN